MVEIVTVLLTREGRTCLVDAFEFTVAHDLGIGIVDLQRTEQGDEGSTLLGSAGVGRTPFLV